MVNTIFRGIDLSQFKGLDAVKHIGPSSIDINTIYQSSGNIPEIFLRGAGIPDSFITYMRSLVGKPFDYYTCFISYSNKDEAFAKRLHADLQSNGVRCWFAPEDMKIGARIRLSIDESIRTYDKLLLVLSQDSMISQWVEQEVETALAKERKENRTVIFPIRLDRQSWRSRVDGQRSSVTRAISPILPVGNTMKPITKRLLDCCSTSRQKREMVILSSHLCHYPYSSKRSQLVYDSLMV